MNKLTGFAAALFVAASADASAQHLEQYFAQTPTAVLPLLDKTAKLDLLDLYNGHLPAKAENLLGGQSEIVRKTDTFLSLRLTDVSSWEMKVLSSGNDTTIACIHSVKAGSTTSQLTAYDTQWREMKYEWPHPDFEEFYQIGNSLSATRNQTLRRLLRSLPVEATWSDTANVLTFRVSTTGLSEDDRADAQQCLHPLSYEWGAGKFQPAPELKGRE